MANSNGWGDGSANNNIGWGQGTVNNNISWGKSQITSWSGATDIDGGNAPVNSVAPAITGTAQEGQTLTCSTGTWSGTPTYTYQWKRNGSNIGSATNSTYTLVTADVGQSIKCTVTATNALGSSNADSNTVTPTALANLLLDTYTNAAVAYSLRKLRSAYSGSAIRVRRSSDNTEQDFGFVTNELDTASMLDFVGYNMWTYSEDVSNAAWSKTFLNTTGTPAYVDVETAPDGTLTGDKIIEATGIANQHGITRSSGTIVNTTSHNVSGYVKQGGRTKIRLLSNISGADQSCDLDLTNGSVSNSTFSNTPVVTAEDNGWYRFSVTITSGTTSATNALQLRLYNASNQLTYSGDGTSGCFAWGWQLSQTSSVKTYQKTVATAGANGFVTTWYDQSTNANNSTQATAVNQAQVVLNGNLRLDPNNNKVSTQWTTDSYSLASNITIAQNFLMFAVINRAATNGVLNHFGSTTLPPQLASQDGLGNIRSQISTPLITHATDTTIGDYIISALRDNSNNVKAFRNGSTLISGINSGTTAVLTRFGMSNNVGSTGYYQEAIYWNTNLEISRSAIETAINTYYSVY